MSHDHIRVAGGAVARITMDRPDRRNALSFAMMGEMIDALRELGGQRETRVIVLAGNGPAFSAGHDLTELTSGDARAHRRIFDRCVELMAAIQQAPQPVIAQVHATATAAGCQLVATCDLATAADSARFATPGVKIGLFCTTPMVALTRAIGRKRALEMLLTGAAIDAATAAEWGLINRVVPAAQLDEATALLAQQIAEASPYTVSLGKRAFYEQIDLDQSAAYQRASGIMCENAADSDAREGMSAFLQKRKPVWRTR